MIQRRLSSLRSRRRDIASVLRGCSPPQFSHDDWRTVVPSRTLFVAGGLDAKYSRIGREWEGMGGVARYLEIGDAGHALLAEAPGEVSSAIVGFLKDEEGTTTIWEGGGDVRTTRSRVGVGAAMGSSVPALLVSGTIERDEEDDIYPAVPSSQLHEVGIMEFEAFSITMGSKNDSGPSSERGGIRGIGWGDAARSGTELRRRDGYVVSVASPRSYDDGTDT